VKSKKLAGKTNAGKNSVAEGTARAVGQNDA